MNTTRHGVAITAPGDTYPFSIIENVIGNKEIPYWLTKKYRFRNEYDALAVLYVYLSFEKEATEESFFWYCRYNLHCIAKRSLMYI